MSCPCGLTREEVFGSHLVGPGGVCTAFKKGSRSEYCGELLADHPQQQPTVTRDEIMTEIKKLTLSLEGMGMNSILTMVSPSVVQHDVERVKGVPLEDYRPSCGEPFLKRDQQRKISKAKVDQEGYNEHYLIVQVTRKHNNLASAINCVFVNSEEESWIHAIHEQSVNELKPDGLVSRHGLYLQCVETGGKTIQEIRKRYKKNGTVFSFGKGIWEIRDMYNGILEWKVSFLPSDRGKLYAYLQHLSREDQMNRYRGILYDTEKFLCAECNGGRMVSIVRGKLTDENSLNHIKTFLSHRNHWLRLLDALCVELNLQLHVLDGRDSAFLGAGKYGRCFSVKKIDGNEVLALKCVLTIDRTDLSEVLALVSNEFNILITLRSIPGVVRAVESSITTVREDVNGEQMALGIGYLMNEVHFPITKKMCQDKDLRKKIGASLVAFHSRGVPIYHGDARIENAVLDKDDNILWVDWMCSVPHMTRESDARQFVQSIYGKNVWRNNLMKESLTKYVNSYGHELNAIMETMMEFEIPA